jgi:hypothetical protein
LMFPSVVKYGTGILVDVCILALRSTGSWRNSLPRRRRSPILPGGDLREFCASRARGGPAASPHLGELLLGDGAGSHPAAVHCRPGSAATGLPGPQGSASAAQPPAPNAEAPAVRHPRAPEVVCPLPVVESKVSGSPAFRWWPCSAKPRRPGKMWETSWGPILAGRRGDAGLCRHCISWCLQPTLAPPPGAQVHRLVVDRNS